MAAPEGDRRLYARRNLTGFMDGAGAQAGWAPLAHESLRAVVALTSDGAIPAPRVYVVLRHLAGVAELLPLALSQLGACLESSLSEYRVTESEPSRDPAHSVAEARKYLEQAAQQANLLRKLLEAAQDAIAGQGYDADDGDRATN
jgi:hypothetical protein